jgi:hypothetical protein
VSAKKATQPIVAVTEIKYILFNGIVLDYRCQPRLLTAPVLTADQLMGGMTCRQSFDAQPGYGQHRFARRLQLLPHC